MKRLLTLIVGLVLGSASITVAHGNVEYMLDESHAHVGFTCEHFGVSYMGGWFTEVSGKAMVDETNLENSQVEFTIETASLQATAEPRREALVSEFFLGVETFPHITFVGKKLTKTDKGLMATGDLTIREVTREVSFPVVVKGPIDDPFGMKRIGVVGSLTVDRRDYGITFDRKMKSGTPLVGDEVTINLSVEFAHKPAE